LQINFAVKIVKNVSLARIFEVKLIEDWKISYIHSLVITFGTGAMEHYRTV